MAGVAEQFQVIGFGISVLFTSLPAWFLSKIGVLCISFIAKEKQESARKYLARWVYRVLGWGWFCTTLFTPWVKIRREATAQLRSGLAAGRGKPRLLLMNHASFMDSFLVLGSLPYVDIADCRTMSASYLFNMPLVGGLAEGCNHLPVVFQSKHDGDFSVDKDKAAEVQRKMNEHVRAGGIGAWYPEGAMNPGDPTKLQTFRAGGFGIATNIDCEIWCICYVGQAKCWPRKSQIGGKPANIGLTTFKLCPSSFELAKKAEVPEGTDPGRAQSVFLANYAQEKMQNEMDALVQKGWVSMVKVEEKTKKSD